MAIRPNSYQIKHALAKNKLEKAVDFCAKGNVNEGDQLFDQGVDELLVLLDSPKYSNNIGYSVHTYISMTLRYYKKRNRIIEEDTILLMYDYLVQSSKKSYDKWMRICRNELFKYCKENYPEDLSLFDISKFDKFKTENYIKSI